MTLSHYTYQLRGVRGKVSGILSVIRANGTYVARRVFENESRETDLDLCRAPPDVGVSAAARAAPANPSAPPLSRDRSPLGGRSITGLHRHPLHRDHSRYSPQNLYVRSRALGRCPLRLISRSRARHRTPVKIFYIFFPSPFDPVATFQAAADNRLGSPASSTAGHFR